MVVVWERICFGISRRIDVGGTHNLAHLFNDQPSLPDLFCAPVASTILPGAGGCKETMIRDNHALLSNPESQLLSTTQISTHIFTGQEEFAGERHS